MTTEHSPDANFLRRWQRWHRFGWPLYLAWSLAGFSVSTMAVVYCARNLYSHGIGFAAWNGPTDTDYFMVAGAIFGSVANILERFSRNEARYERLEQADRGHEIRTDAEEISRL